MMVLICISQRINGVEHVSVCLLAICISSLENRLLKSCVSILIWLFAF